MASEEANKEFIKSRIALLYPSLEDHIYEIMKFYEFATEEINASCYTGKNYQKALFYFMLHSWYKVKCKCGDLCDSFDSPTKQIKGEKINDISVNYEDKEIDGIIPQDEFHYHFLMLPKCNIETSFNVSMDTCNSGNWITGTDGSPYEVDF